MDYNKDRIEQSKKIVEALVPKSMFYNTDVLITGDGFVVIITDKTVMYTVPLKEDVTSVGFVHPTIAFKYKDIMDLNLEECNDYPNDLFLSDDMYSLYCYYNNTLCRLPIAHIADARGDEKFEELLQLKASDGMKFYHMLGKDMNTYLIPVFSGLPNLSKQDKLDIYLYDLQNAYLLVDMHIFKKKLNREISVRYRILKLN